MSTIGLSIARERVRVLNESTAAGSPVVDVADHAWKKPKRKFKCYGAAKEFFESKEKRVIIGGPAETGKTMVSLHLLDHLAWNYPRMQAVIVRARYTDMPASVLQTYENKVIGMAQGESKTADGITKHGGEYPRFYTYPNGSRVWVCGMDKPGKVLSTERDLVYVNQAEEIDQNSWETLVTRTTGRAGAMKPARLLGDCNPGPSTHWIPELAQAGALRLINSRHEDNPVLFDQETGQITEQGVITLADLDSLTGVRYKRLRLGLWVAAEGVVYETFDKTVHIRPQPWTDILWYLVSVDWGFTNPGVIQVWGVDSDGRMYRVKEIYRTKKLVAASQPEDAWWINEAKKINEEYGPRNFVCDPAEPSYISAFQLAGLPAIPAFNSIEPGIQAVESRLKIQDDGRARLYLLSDSKGEVDPELKKRHIPTCLEDEMEVYRWDKDKAGKSRKEVPIKEHDHACDAMRYAVAFVDDLGTQNKLMFA